MARQMAASSSSGSVLVDARLREGRAILSAPGNQSAARPIILDNAGHLDAEKLLTWARAVTGQDSNRRLPRFVLVGGPFGEPALHGDRPGLRVASIQMGPLSLFEASPAALKRLWLRGGYPEAFGAASDEAASIWLESYAADLAGMSLATWDLPREPDLITGLFETIAANNGRTFNENAAARALGVSRPTICRYLGILERAGILFRVPALPMDPASLGSVPAPKKTGTSRTIKAPALYINDSGLLHALLGIRSTDDLALKPSLAAASWAGFVVGQVRQILPPDTLLYRHASADKAKLDLVVVKAGLPILVAAARRHRPNSVERSIAYAARTLGSAPGRFIVVPDGGERKLPGEFTVIGLGAFLERLSGA